MSLLCIALVCTSFFALATQSNAEELAVSAGSSHDMLAVDLDSRGAIHVRHPSTLATEVLPGLGEASSSSDGVPPLMRKQQSRDVDEMLSLDGDSHPATQGSANMIKQHALDDDQSLADVSQIQTPKVGAPPTGSMEAPPLLEPGNSDHDRYDALGGSADSPADPFWQSLVESALAYDEVKNPGKSPHAGSSSGAPPPDHAAKPGAKAKPSPAKPAPQSALITKMIQDVVAGSAKLEQELGDAHLDEPVTVPQRMDNPAMPGAELELEPNNDLVKSMHRLEALAKFQDGELPSDKASAKAQLAPLLQETSGAKSDALEAIKAMAAW